MLTRKLEIVHTPAPHPGFLGAGHIARAVIERDFYDSDPFIMLMDDRLDKKDNKPVGGPHPHAGFETVTLVLEGEVGDFIHQMKAGDLQIMTAGSGIVHTETIDKELRLHILQLWITLPKEQRWITPRVQNLSSAQVPEAQGEGWKVRVYSGSFAGATSPIQNYAPFILADIRLEAGASMTQQIPASYTAFMYVIDGSAEVGNEGKAIHQDQVGWLNRENEYAPSELQLTAGKDGVRLVLYAGQPQHADIVSYGPFIGDTREDIARLYHEYNRGKMKHVSTLPEAQTINY